MRTLCAAGFAFFICNASSLGCFLKFKSKELIKKIYSISRVVIAAFLAFVPIAVLMILAFADTWTMPAVLPEKITTRHVWMQVKGSLGYSFLLSLGLGLFVGLTATFGGFFASKMIAKQKKKDAWHAINLLPYVLSPIIYGAALQYFFVRFDLSGTFIGVALAQLLIAFPFATIVWSSFWQKKVFDMEALTFTLGGSASQAFWKVLFPLARGTFALCFFQTFLISWFDFAMASLIGLGKTKTLTVHVFQLINEANIHAAAVGTICLVLPPLLLLFFQKKSILRARS